MPCEPFKYPDRPHLRKHGPKGFTHHRSYLNWLRDDFSFRCVYCLRRETWLTMRRDFEVDHFLPSSISPTKALDYDNLVYACRSCNGSKSNNMITDPCHIALGSCLEVAHDGNIRALNAEGDVLIKRLGFDYEDYVRLRETIFELLELAPEGSDAFKRLFGFPSNLPDLSRETKLPNGNSRSAGINQSYAELLKRGELPEYY